MSDKGFAKKVFKSKTAVTSCGYCNIKIKEENLENHCRSVHKKHKLVAGQSTLDRLFRPQQKVPPVVVEPDITPPWSKKLKVSEDIPETEEALSLSNTDEDNNLPLHHVAYDNAEDSSGSEDPSGKVKEETTAASIESMNILSSF